LLFVRVVPIKAPIGVIPISTPNKKIDSPIIINKAPRINFINKEISIGTIVKFKAKTITIIGSTEYNTSLILSTITVK